MSIEHHGGLVNSANTRVAAHRQAVRSRRLKRLEETREIKVRAEFRRRKAVTRSGVMVSFVLAMVIYPMLGTLTPYAGALDNVPGVTLGETPSTAHAILGDGPQLRDVSLPPPTVDEQAIAQLISRDMETFSVSQHLPDCDPSVEVTGTNGKLNEEALCTLWDGKVRLRADAAVALAELNQRFRIQFGRDLCIYEGYRSYADQVSIRQRRGGLAASPGKSVHGWGLAIDLCGADDSGAAKQWLDDNGPMWGWVNPDWAKTRKWEPWHWEYLPGTDAMNFYNGATWESDDGEEISSDSDEPTKPKTTTTTTDPEPTAPEPEPEPTPQPTPSPSPAPAG